MSGIEPTTIFNGYSLNIPIINTVNSICEDNSPTIQRKTVGKNPYPICNSINDLITYKSSISVAYNSSESSYTIKNPSSEITKYYETK